MKIFHIRVEDNLADSLLNFLKNISQRGLFYEVKEERYNRRQKNPHRFSALKLDTKNLRFDRDEANER